jgi:glutathione S-transferase
MTLKLYYHPRSSYCHKALVALYEHGVVFEPVFIGPRRRAIERADAGQD